MVELKSLNVPTWLTIIRLAVSPLLLPVLFVWFLPQNSFGINVVLALVFIMFGLTDFFDGYLARRYCQETLLGKVLDPIADKFLVYSTLVALQAIGKIYYYWVVLLIGREFFVMGLRLIALEYKTSVPVSYGGKLKTMIQMILLVVLILNPYQALGLFGAPVWNGGEYLLLMTTMVLSLYSAWDYYRLLELPLMNHK